MAIVCSLIFGTQTLNAFRKKVAPINILTFKTETKTKHTHVYVLNNDKDSFHLK